MNDNATHDQYNTVDDWLNEFEGYSLRFERMIDECGNSPRLRAWIETAWRLGAEAERRACIGIADAHSLGTILPDATATHIGNMIAARGIEDGAEAEST